MRYEIREDSGASEVIDADTMEQALSIARDWASEGSYSKRVVVTVYVDELDEDDEPTGIRARDEVAAGPEPEPPPCREEEEHDWHSPAWLGGCNENPGVWSLGGTRMVFRTVCRYCGLYRRIESAGAQRNPGELDEEVTYEPADEQSLAHRERND